MCEGIPLGRLRGGLRKLNSDKKGEGHHDMRCPSCFDMHFSVLRACILCILAYFGDKSKAQVVYDIDIAKTFERETSSLVKASEALHCDHLTLVALTSSRDITIDGKTIHVVSALEWFLKRS